MSLNVFSLSNEVFLNQALCSPCSFQILLVNELHLSCSPLALQWQHIQSHFEAYDLRHDNRALIKLAICLGFVSFFVPLLSAFQYLFSVFQKSFVYLLPLCVIWLGSFLLSVLLLKQPSLEWNLVYASLPEQGVV